MVEAKGEKAKAAVEAAANEAKEKARKERKAVAAAVRATIPASGNRWIMVAGGNNLRKFVVIVLIKQKLTNMTPKIRARWDKLIRKVNNLIIHAESQGGAKQFFGVNRLACNVAKSFPIQ